MMDSHAHQKLNSKGKVEVAEKQPLGYRVGSQDFPLTKKMLKFQLSKVMELLEDVECDRFTFEVKQV